jgi:hypothetical protein
MPCPYTCHMPMPHCHIATLPHCHIATLPHCPSFSSYGHGMPCPYTRPMPMPHCHIAHPFPRTGTACRAPTHAQCPCHIATLPILFLVRARHAVPLHMPNAHATLPPTGTACRAPTYAHTHSPVRARHAVPVHMPHCHIAHPSPTRCDPIIHTI